MGDGVSNERVIAFGSLAGVHFARLVLVPPVDPRDASTLILHERRGRSPGRPSGRAGGDSRARASTRCSATAAAIRRCRPAPPPGSRSCATGPCAPTRPTSTGPGRTVAQVRDEALLRDAIEAYLDSARPELERRSAPGRAGAGAGVRRGRRARSRSPPRPRRARSWARACATGSTACGCRRRCSCSRRFWSSPRRPWLVLLRIHERQRSRARTSAPTRPRVALIAGLEDHLAQNAFTALGRVKPGPFRRLARRSALLWVADWATPAPVRARRPGRGEDDPLRPLGVPRRPQPPGLREQLRRQPRDATWATSSTRWRGA